MHNAQNILTHTSNNITTFISRNNGKIVIVNKENPIH